MPLLQTHDASFDQPADALAPRTVDLDRYEVMEQLGEGGIGTVLRARDKRLNRWVAIKLLRRLSADHERRFFYEAELTARLEHPAIVPIHDVGRWHTGEPFYAMKLVEGQSLREVASACTTLAARLPLVVSVLTVCDAIGYAHAKGVIHRDLKPSNVMVGSYGETLVIDWGLARHLEAPDAQAISGTPHYMAPEQARGEAVDARCDVYALGAMLYEVLGSKAPYEEISSSQVLAQVTSRPPTPLLTLAPDVPGELAAIVAKAMSRAAGNRYPDAQALGADLRRYLDGRLVGAYRYSSWSRLKRNALGNKPATAAIALGILALLLVGSLSLRRIVAERDGARAARALAEHAQSLAEARRDQLLLSQARLWLDRDPTAAFAWARAFAATASARADSTSLIAATAVGRTVATQLTRGRKRVVLSSDGQTLAGIEGDRLILWSITDARERVLGTLSSKQAVLRFSSDGKSVLAAEGKTLRRWPVGGGVPEILFTAAQDLSALFAAGEAIAVAGEEGAVWWSARAGAPFAAQPSLASRVIGLELSAVGPLLVASDADGAFEVLLPPAAPALLIGKSSGGARLSADGSRVVWGDGSSALWAFEVSSRKTTALKKAHEGAIPLVAVSADGQWLASFGQDHLVVLDNLVTSERRVLKGHEGWVVNGSFSPDGSQLLTVSQDRTARLWHLATGDVEVLRGHGAPFRTLTFTPDSSQVVTGDAEGEVRVWHALRPSGRVFQGHQSQYVEARFLPDGKLASAGEDGQLNLWDPSDRQKVTFKEPGPAGSLSVQGGRLSNAGGAGAWVRTLSNLSLHSQMLQTSEVHQAVLNLEGTLLATAGADHTVRIFTLPAGTERRLGSHPCAVWHVAFSPDGRFVASAGDDFPIRIWPLGEGAPRELAGPEAVSFDLQFSPDGKWLAAGGVDATVHLWHTNDWTHLALKGHQGLIRQLAFSPDSSLLASASDDHSVRLWKLGTSEAPRVLQHESMVYTAIFSRDGTQLVSGSDDGAVRLWDGAKGTLLKVAAGHRGPVTGLTQSPDGRALGSVAEDLTVRHWPDFFLPAPVLDNSAALAAISSVVLLEDRAISPSGPAR